MLQSGYNFGSRRAHDADMKKQSFLSLLARGFTRHSGSDCRFFVLLILLSPWGPGLAQGPTPPPTSAEPAKDPAAAAPERFPAAKEAEAKPLPAALAQGILEEEGTLNLRAAIRNYQAVLGHYAEQRRYAATALFRLGECYRKLGQTNEAQLQYQRVLREFPEEADLARLCQGLVAPGESLAATTTDAELERIKAIGRQSPDLLNAVGNNEETLLQSSAAKGQLGVVRYLLEHGAAVNGLKSPELTPLHYAAGNGHLAIVDLLLQRRANVDATTESGVSALHVAVSKGYGKVAKALLDAGANVKLAVQRQVNADRANLRYSMPAGARPLDLAIANGDAAMVELLVSRGADLSASGLVGPTPLHAAAAKGVTPIIETLILSGADVNAADQNGSTPLHAAAAGGHSSVVQRLVRTKAEINARDRAGETPLLVAAKARQADVAKALLELGADPNLMPPNGASALHFAVAAEDEALTRELLRRGADPNRRAEQRPFPVRPSVGASLQTLWQWHDPGSPLITAGELGNLTLLKLLFAHGSQFPTDAREALGLMAQPAVFNQPEILRLFLSNHANPNAASENKETLLHVVAKWGSTNTLAVLVSNGANPNARSSTGATPLHYAVAADRPDLVAALLAAGADPNALDDEGWTPLDLTKSDRTRMFGGPYARITPGRQGGTMVPPLSGGPILSTVATGQIADTLKRAGALEEMPRLDRISIRRPHGQDPQVLFRRGTNDWNRFSLLEAIAAWYNLISPSQEWRTSPGYSLQVFFSRFGSSNNHYPDFSAVTIRRPGADGRSWKEEHLDLTKSFSAGDCHSDVPLSWGDLIEIPEVDHPVNDRWLGLTEGVLVVLKKCLARSVTVITSGKTNVLTLAPSIRIPENVGGAVIEPGIPFMLRPALLNSGLSLTTADLTQVKVTRADAKTQWILNTAETQTAPGLWLQDGDIIEVERKR